MSFEDRIKEAKKFLEKGKKLTVYQDGMPNFIINSTIYGKTPLNFDLEHDAIMELRKAERWIAC